jgi:hypothetical protein
MACGIYSRNLPVTKCPILYSTSNEETELTQNDRIIGDKERRRQERQEEGEVGWEEKNKEHDLSQTRSVPIIENLNRKY